MTKYSIRLETLTVALLSLTIQHLAASTPTCPSTATVAGVGMNLSVLTKDAFGNITKPVAGQTVNACTPLWVVATLFYVPTGSQGSIGAGFSDGQVNISTIAPNTPFNVNDTPPGGIPLIGPTGDPANCPGAVPLASTPVVFWGYPQAADIVAGHITFTASYSGGTAWLDGGTSASASIQEDVFVSSAACSPTLAWREKILFYQTVRGYLGWPKSLLPPGSGPDTNELTFGLQRSDVPLGSGVGEWSVFPNDPIYGVPMVRTMDDQFVSRDEILDTGVHLYRLISPAPTNMLIIPPATTLAASNVTCVGDCLHPLYLNGATTPVGDGTLYWFQYGPNTNYGYCSVTNSLPTDTNLAQVSITVTGAVASTLHHFQLLVIDDFGLQHGGDMPWNVQPFAFITAITNVTTNSAVVYIEANANSVDTWVWLFYYSDTFTGDTTPTYVGNGTAPYDYNQAIRLLLPQTTYHVQTVASNSYGVVYGPVSSFTTGTLPTVQTLGPANFQFTQLGGSANLQGSVNPNGFAATAWFEYGLSTNSGSLSGTPPIGVGSGTTPVQLSNTVSFGFSTTYYRLDASNSFGTVYGSFTNF